jgi:hypothetical protein
VQCSYALCGKTGSLVGGDSPLAFSKKISQLQAICEGSDNGAARLPVRVPGKGAEGQHNYVWRHVSSVCFMKKEPVAPSVLLFCDF